VAYFLGHPVGI